MNVIGVQGHRGTVTEGTAGTEETKAGLVLMVPVGDDLNEFELRLVTMESMLETIITGAKGAAPTSQFWLKALKGAELQARTPTNTDLPGLTRTRDEEPR